MMDNKGCVNSHQKESICIDTFRVLDSCRDKDCFENVKVYLTEFGEEIIERTSAIRAKCAKIICAYIDVNDVPFNRGFYQLNIKIYVRITFEACVSHGNIQEFEGVAVVEKKVILFGSEGNVSVFKSDSSVSGFCNSTPCEGVHSSTSPRAVFETVDPIVLNVKIFEPRESNCCCCCCCLDDLPDYVVKQVNGHLIDRNERVLAVSLGFFSVVKIERPAQLIVNATEYNIPEKECITTTEDDPCKLFKAMAFPIGEFNPPIFHGSSCPCSVTTPKREKEQGGRCVCN